MSLISELGYYQEMTDMKDLSTEQFVRELGFSFTHDDDKR